MTEPPPTTLPLHTPPRPFTPSSLTLISQGAEALVYTTPFLAPSTLSILKYRPPKPYRHPTLDRRLTRQRLLAEARSLLRVKKEGVNVPGVLGVDADAGWLVLEFLHGETIKGVLDGWARRREAKEGAQDGRDDDDDDDDDEEGKGGQDGKHDHDQDMMALMARIGGEIAKLHAVGVCHGDLTTSNMLVCSPPPPLQADEAKRVLRDGTVYLIDFGLTSASIADEDKAVDLYVLERAFSATHPAAEPLFHEVLRAYRASGRAAAASVLKRLDGVRRRGRKRSMLG